MVEIDINCDVGEGMGNEADIMPLVSSCNIACGAHAGNPQIIRETIRLAQKWKVKIGAHPSYPDRANFGRKVMEISSEALILSIRKQLLNFMEMLKKERAELHHIKPHGALYNEIAKNKIQANVFLEAIKDFESIPLYVPFQSEIHKAARKRGFPIVIEAFADRNYNSNLTLVSRREENALIQDPKEVLVRILSMVKDGKVISVQGEHVAINANTFCVHGDTPSALEILAYLHRELPKHHIQISK